MAHLVSSGRRVVATIAGPQDMAPGVDRLAGYREALREAKLRHEHDLEAVSDFTQEGGAAAMDRLLRTRPDIDAVFAASDQMAAGALSVLTAAGRHVPVLAVLSLPVLFAAGMSLMDTADGAFMTHAYRWAFANPVRKVYYNLTVTSLSVTVALGVGTVELLQVAGGRFAWLDALDFNTLGYVIAALFVLTWLTSAVVWKVRRVEERWAPALAEARGPRTG